MCSDLAPRCDGTRRLALDKMQKPSHLDGQLVVGEICQMVRNHPLIIDAGARSPVLDVGEGGREGGRRRSCKQGKTDICPLIP